MLLAVNGTLMRDLPLCGNLQAAGATFVCEARTSPAYRLWSVKDEFPGMLQVKHGGAAIAVEIWDIDPHGILEVFLKEPPGLSLGWVTLDDESQVIGILAEAATVEGMVDITEFGGWRAYLSRQPRLSRLRTSRCK
jgi:hypothetical protein